MNLTVDEPNRVRRRRQRVEKRRQFERTDPICELLLIAVVVGSALAIGTVHISVLLVVSVLALAGGTLAALACRRLPRPAMLLGALGLFSALQAIPLPARWVERLSPSSAQVWLRCLVPFGQQPLTRFPISHDGSASMAEALKWLTYAAIYITAARVRSRRGSAWLAALIFISAALVALITLIHGAADVSLLYGVYKPNFTISRWSVGPLLNSNNFAGYANLGLFAGAGLLLSGRPILPRVVLLLGLTEICTASLLSGSRAGLLSALVGGSIVLLWLARIDRTRPSIARLLTGAAPLLAGVVAALALGSSKNWKALATGDVHRKIAVWVWSLPMIREHAWFGVGRGAFETAFPPYRGVLDADWTASFSHAENFVLQWLTEWGVPVGLFAIVTIVGYILLEWLAARGDRLRFVLLTGLAVLLLQNLADLGLEVPAVAIAAVLVLAAGEHPTPRAPSGPVFPHNAILVAGSLLLVWSVACFSSRWPVEVERREMSADYRALAVDSPDELALFRAQLRDAMLRHPGESFFPLLGSVLAYRTKDASPLPWIARALELGPTNGRVHLVLAQFLGAHKATAQAMLHLRLAAEYDGTLGAATGARAAQWAPSLEVLLQSIPKGPIGDTMLASACAKVRSELKIACFRVAAVRNPGDQVVQTQLADSLLSAIRKRDWPCNGDLADGCAQEVDRTARAIAKLDPKSWRPGYIIGKVLLARGDTAGAAAILAKVCPGDAEGRECARDSLSAAIATGSDAAILTAADRYSVRACENAASCAGTLDWIGSTLEAGGKLAFAISYYSKGAEAEGSAARWLRVADRANQAGLIGVARLALERADRSPDATPNSRAHTEQLRGRIARSIAAADAL